MLHCPSSELSSHTPYNPYLTKQYDLFISHCGRDCKAAVALPVKAQLQAQDGLKVFVDETDLPFGGDAPCNMEQALLRCKVRLGCAHPFKSSRDGPVHHG